MFEDNQSHVEAAISTDRHHMVWAGAKDVPVGNYTTYVEDVFLRSKGLSAELVAPLSLILNDLGIYYDPTRPSHLEELLRMRKILCPHQKQRAERMIAALIQARLNKYNVGSPELVDLPKGHRILVPGQVEDDTSILTGTKSVNTNMALLSAGRAANRDAVILYKAQPDVETGLRKGLVANEDTAHLCDAVLHKCDPIAAIDASDEVWTMTSFLGFEALLRGKTVTCLGAPFYAGWGLTTDLGPVPALRSTEITLESLLHAAFIDYPLYFDSITQQPCPAEVVLERLVSGKVTKPKLFNRILSKL